MQPIQSRAQRRSTRRAAGILTLGLMSIGAAAPSSAQGPLPPPLAPAENPITVQKAVLGKALFWDEQLSSDGTMACGTCHIPRSGGTDARVGNTAAHPGPDGIPGTQDDVFGSPGISASNAFGHFTSHQTFGFDVQATDRLTPSMIASAYFPSLFWDGRATNQFSDPVTGQVVIQDRGALESQSLQPLQSDVEMAFASRDWAGLTDRLEAARPLALAANIPADLQAALSIDPTYPELFQNAFGTDEITPVRIAFALATYQRTLVPDQSRFDQVMRGQAQFTQAEARGRDAFASPQSRCVQCHAGSLFSDGQFHNLGLRPIAEDQGRSAVTGNNADRGRFKTPSLRNVALRSRFFHTGAPGVDSLIEVMQFYDQDGGQFPENKDPILNGLTVPPPVGIDIVAFLNTLTDPRVAAETAPFDRPTLWSERFNPNPMPLGIGAVAGSLGIVPQIIATAPPKMGNTGFRIGVEQAYGGAWALLYVRLNLAPGPPTLHRRDGLPFPQVLEGAGPGGGFGTWIDPEATRPVMVGVSYNAQWVVRDPGAPSGVSRSELVRITIE